MVEGAPRQDRHEECPDEGGAEARRDVSGLAHGRRTHQEGSRQGLFGIPLQESSSEVGVLEGRRLDIRQGWR